MTTDSHAALLAPAFSLPAACLDCGLDYADFPLDVILPRPQWLEIHPSDGGLLCAACIVKRAAHVKGVTCVHAILEIAPPRSTLPVEPPGWQQQLAEQRAELTGNLSELFKNIPACYDTPADHYREMARRLVEDRDGLKHRVRALEEELRATHAALPVERSAQPAEGSPRELVDLVKLVADIDEIRGAYGYLLMQIALTSDASLFAIGQEEEARHRETFARFEQRLSRHGLSNQESWMAFAKEIVARPAALPVERPIWHPTERSVVSTSVERSTQHDPPFVSSITLPTAAQVRAEGFESVEVSGTNPERPICDCGAARPKSSRYGHSHLWWCVAAERPAPHDFTASAHTPVSC